MLRFKITPQIGFFFLRWAESCIGVGKWGLLEKGSFHKNAHFLEILEKLEILENLRTLDNKGEAQNLLETLESLEILEIPRAKRPLS